MVFRLKLQWDISKLTISGMILGVVTLERGPQTLDVLGESCKRISCPPTHPNMNLSEFPWMCFWNNIFFWSFFHHRCCHLEWYTYPIIPLIKGNFFFNPLPPGKHLVDAIPTRSMLPSTLPMWVVCFFLVIASDMVARSHNQFCEDSCVFDSLRIGKLNRSKWTVQWG